MIFTKAIVRKPCNSFVNGISSAQLGKPDIYKALYQHEHYKKALEKCGLEVICLEPDNNYPDSVFVEDTAVVTKEFGIITNPQPDSRKEEIEDIQSILKKYFQNLHFINQPATLEGGDIMKTGSHFFVGLTSRTNQEGTIQFNNVVKDYGYTSSTLSISNLLHLKTGCSYLENNTILLTKELSKLPAFKSYRKIIVDTEEEYAANSLWINGTVLVPDHFPGTKGKIEKAGYPTIPVDISEFRKLDGGLSCLSLRF